MEPLAYKNARFCPLPSLGEFIFTLRVYPECGEEVYATLVPPPLPPEQP
jgi:hypothetical protein